MGCFWKFCWWLTIQYRGQVLKKEPNCGKERPTWLYLGLQKIVCINVFKKKDSIIFPSLKWWPAKKWSFAKQISSWWFQTFLFLHLLGERIQFDLTNVFRIGWNHQLDFFCMCFFGTGGRVPVLGHETQPLCVPQQRVVSGASKSLIIRLAIS